jgi:hypothetical protein
MEVGMARERAEMARQRTELQRLHAEVRHELETLQRTDGALATRLAQFQRRHQDVINRPGGAAGDPRNSGVVKRLFGNS